MAVTFVAKSLLPTSFATFTMHGFLDEKTKREHVALTLGELNNPPTLIRIHSECLTGDALFSLRCDCGFQLQSALQQIAINGSGALLYLRQEGRGIGLLNKIKAYNLQDQGADTVEANHHLGFADDLRDYSICSFILAHLKISQVKLMTNNPRKVTALEELGINVVERIALQVGKNEHNSHYLATKLHKLGHLLTE